MDSVMTGNAAYRCHSRACVLARRVEWLVIRLSRHPDMTSVSQANLLCRPPQNQAVKFWKNDFGYYPRVEPLGSADAQRHRAVDALTAALQAEQLLQAVDDAPLSGVVSPNRLRNFPFQIDTSVDVR